MNILVLGANGQLGRCLVDQLAGTDHDCVFSSRCDIDITDFAATRIKIQRINPDVIINASAYTAVDRAESEPEQADLINHVSVANIAQICADVKSALIHISTDYVFDGEACSPYKETAQTNPQTVYGKTKLLGELAIQESGCKYLIIRTAWVFSEYGNNFLKTMLRLGAELDELNIVSDQIGCPTYAQDIAKATILVLPHLTMKYFGSAIYNFCGDDSCSWYEFAQVIFAEAQDHGFVIPIRVNPITSSEYRTSASRPPYSVLDCDKIEAAFCTVRSNWRLGIRSALSQLQKN